MQRLTTLSVLFHAFLQVITAPSDHSLVVRSTETSEKRLQNDLPAEAFPIQISAMCVQSRISNRFANTTVTSKVKNYGEKAQEAVFSVVLPETAFISGFIMEIDGKNYTAYVKEKEEAKKDYDQAVASGVGAAHVAVSARDSNRFTVSVNVEPQSKAAFYLTYEQLLKREDGRYEQVINLHPGQPVQDLNVEVHIVESRKITELKAPPLRSGNEVGKEDAELDPRVDIKTINDNEAVVSFSPNVERQKQLAHLLGTEESKGLAGQFVVQYDVERDPQGGEVLVQDGYFVHFFAPSELAPLPKHVVFVLDTSGSMYNQKIRQLKEAMHKILDQLHEQDLFSIVEFNSIIKTWDLDNPEATVWYSSNYKNSEIVFNNITFPDAYSASADNIKKAKATVSSMEATGGTDIHAALMVSLHLVELAKTQKTNITRQPIIMFLTDGEPTVHIVNTEEITNRITAANKDVRKAPIFALSFGSGADKNFLQKLALRNSGFSKHIYEAADASLQLQDFYRQISSPLLANVTFKYEPSVTSLTITEFPIYFHGSELVVAGRYAVDADFTPPIVTGDGLGKSIILKSVKTERPVSNIERLWAYLTVKQLLDKKELTDKDKEELKKNALDIALKYSFVTPVSSLVVVKPNSTSKAVDTEDASKSQGPHYQYAASSSASRSGLHIRPVYSSLSISSYSRPADHIDSRSGSHIRPVYSPISVSSYSRPAVHTAYELPAGQYDADTDRILGGSLITSVPSTYRSTYQPTSIQTKSTPTNDLFTVLPWLKSILSENGNVNIPAGSYKLGLNETIVDNVDCPKTPLNTPGHCSLLHECSQVHSLLTSADVFIQHSCVLKNEYAGVCCPNTVRQL